jgi:hypothetical protein
MQASPYTGRHNVLHHFKFETSLTRLVPLLNIKNTLIIWMVRAPWPLYIYDHCAMLQPALLACTL